MRKYRVVDNAFNRENYKNMIGEVYDNPPSYAAVEEVNRCGDRFETVVKIYNVGHALAYGWDRIQPEHREEFLGKLRTHVVDMSEQGIGRKREANNLLDFIDTLDSYNKGEGTIHDLLGKMDGLTEELAIHAIADCECAKTIT
jgi:hypothetical protein